MTFVLSSQNVFEYLMQQGLCTETDPDQSQVELKYAKNFNLLLSLPNDRKLLVKQEPLNQKGETAGEFLHEWRMQAFLQEFPELQPIRSQISEAIHFDPDHGIIVFNYLERYRDLVDFYVKENVFPTAIATQLGTVLATIHRLTWHHAEYQAFYTEKIVPQRSTEQIPEHSPEQIPEQIPESATEPESAKFRSPLVQPIGRISTDIFGMVPADGLKFFALYQRYDSLGQAIAELAATYRPCCLTHNDLKLNNVLVSTDWETDGFTEDTATSSVIRLIDWERSTWGDPAFDLGTVIASYLYQWLTSLVTSRSISIDEALRLATTPLEVLQPSLSALAIAYLTAFPDVTHQYPQFIQRAVQFAGLGLIHAIQSMLQYQKSFGNSGICTLQVAKSLLCRPDTAIRTVFGGEFATQLDQTHSLLSFTAKHYATD